MVSQKDQKDIAKQTGEALGALVVDAVVRTVVDKASGEVSRLQRLAGEIEQQHAERRSHCEKLDKGIRDKTAEVAALNAQIRDKQAAVDSLQAKITELTPKADELEARVRRYAHDSLKIIGKEARS